MTLRERDTTTQLIGKVDEVIQVIQDLVDGSASWQDACSRLPAYTGSQEI